MTAPIVSDWHQREAEVPASKAASASCYDLPEHIFALAVIEAELKLREIQRQIFLAHIMVTTHDPAFDQTPKRFDRLSVRDTANPFFILLIDRFVLVAKFFQVAIDGCFVRRNQTHALVGDSADKFFGRIGIDVLHHLADDITLARDCADDGRLAACSPSARVFLVAMLIGALSTDVGFVHFHDAEQLRKPVILHRGAHAMAHIPSGLIGTRADDALHLHGAHSLLGLHHQVGDLEPRSERVLRILKDRAADNAESIAVALMADGHRASLFIDRLRAALAYPVEGAMRHVKYLFASALRAFDAVRPAARNQILLAGFFGRELFQQLFQRHPQNIHILACGVNCGIFPN